MRTLLWISIKLSESITTFQLPGLMSPPSTSPTAMLSLEIWLQIINHLPSCIHSGIRVHLPPGYCMSVHHSMISCYWDVDASVSGWATYFPSEHLIVRSMCPAVPHGEKSRFLHRLIISLIGGAGVRDSVANLQRVASQPFNSGIASILDSLV